MTNETTNCFPLGTRVYVSRMLGYRDFGLGEVVGRGPGGSVGVKLRKLDDIIIVDPSNLWLLSRSKASEKQAHKHTRSQS